MQCGFRTTITPLALRISNNNNLRREGASILLSYSAVYLPNRVLALAALADEWMATSLSDLQADELQGSGEEVNDSDYEDEVGRTELMDAAVGGHTDTVTALLAAPGIDVNAANGLGWTALMRAAVGGHTETVWALLATPGLDVNTATDAGVTALMLSATRGHTATVRALLATLQLALAPRHSCTFYRASRVVRRLAGVRRRALSSRSPASPPSLATGPPSPRSHSLPVEPLQVQFFQRSRTLPYSI